MLMLCCSEMIFSGVATVSIIPLEPRESREDIQCPGDIIPFNCSILSNSETINLTWFINVPGMAPVNITYSNISTGIHDLASYSSTTLTDFHSDEYIRSTLEFRVQPGIPILQFNLSCLITGLGLNSTIVHINTSRKLIGNTKTTLCYS